ncbi:keratin-associated protein 9-1-like [Wyeomyia smithii]|uniref:keratin-associated protein 9-1-like n=1 Tax=Wyeomyia smithii TaxID=174621 RepID=UPI002467B364|nr:keratin-associated protein 9-1-like [Wyeomyia smithii]
MRTLLFLFLLPYSFVLGLSIVANTPRSIMCRTCKRDEVLSEVVPCCEPTCENDCSLANCPKKVIYKQTCVCRPGYVRHQGECIAETDCPSVEDSLPTCRSNEELQPTPPCCEPSCLRNCTNVICRTELVHKPTCVCEQGCVRHNGRCIKPDQCPTCGPYARFSHCTPCCEPTCYDDCSQILCLKPCSGGPRCLCQPGYVKHRGMCIRKEACPLESASIEAASSEEENFNPLSQQTNDLEDIFFRDFPNYL